MNRICFVRVLLMVALLGCSPSDFSIEVTGSLASGVWFEVADANGNPVDVELLRVTRVDGQHRNEVLWATEGSARLGLIKYGESIEGMMSKTDSISLEANAVYRVEGVGRSAGGYWSGTLVTGERYFEVDDGGAIKVCGPCSKCEMLVDVFGACQE